VREAEIADAVGRLAHDSVDEDAVDAAGELAGAFIAGEVAACGGVPLPDVPKRTTIFGPFCYFAGKVLEVNDRVADEVCRFLIGWN
jgi:hypothetical protein